MPSLLIFGICEKAIIDRETNQVSMINIINGATVQPIEGEFAADAVIPMPWACVSTWQKEPDDEGKTFEQRLDLVKPNDETLHLSDLPFKMSQERHQNYVASNGFPVGQTGKYQVQIWLREIEEGKEWELLREYPLLIAHNLQKGEGE
jgi:hypothetical protein